MPALLTAQVLRFENFEFPFDYLSGDIAQSLRSALEQDVTIPGYSIAALKEAAETLSLNCRNITETIKNLKDAIRVLGEKQVELKEHEQLVRHVSSRPIRSFPPLPLDVAEQVINMACEDDLETATSCSMVSKQLQTWADKHLWSTIVANTTSQANNLSLLLREPSFSSGRGKMIRVFCINSISSDCIPLELFPLPEIYHFSYWNIVEPGWSLTDVQTSPSLRSISCQATTLFPPGLESTAASLHILHNLTHLDISDGLSDTWDWSFLMNLSCLTHFMANCSFLQWGEAFGQNHSSFLSSLISSLPPSVQLAIIDFNEEMPGVMLYEQLRTGSLDRRVLVGVFLGEPVLEWVLHLPSSSFGRPVSAKPWATGGYKRIWELGVKMLTERNLKLAL